MLRPSTACPLTGVVTLLAFCAVTPAVGQVVLDGREDIAFDRPEAWAMQYFASASLPSTTVAAQPQRAGEWELALEYAQIPSLSEEERTVGFDGTKTEDLNRVPFVLRPAVRVGLGAELTLAASYLPPVEFDDVEPHVLTLSLSRPLVDSDSWTLGLGLVGQVGRAEGDFTCSAAQVAAGADREVNPFGCEAPSRDEHRFATVGLELGARWKLGAEGAWRPYFAFAYHHMDLEFRVDARYSGVIDRTVLMTDGQTWSGAAGLAYTLSDRWSLSSELFYTPLDVVRPPEASSRTDELLNVRAVLRYAL